jgi:HTH-type transcriptional regulator/antitoxin HigA
MQTLNLSKATTAWTKLSTTLFVPHTEADYDHLVTVLDQLIDQVGENEYHPLASMMEVIGVLIENYEIQHVPELKETA